jgi:hypothetical protein
MSFIVNETSAIMSNHPHAIWVAISKPVGLKKESVEKLISWRLGISHGLY